jgi:hypothetical protein
VSLRSLSSMGYGAYSKGRSHGVGLQVTLSALGIRGNTVWKREANYAVLCYESVAYHNGTQQTSQLPDRIRVAHSLALFVYMANIVECVGRMWHNALHDRGTTDMTFIKKSDCLIQCGFIIMSINTLECRVEKGGRTSSRLRGSNHMVALERRGKHITAASVARKNSRTP